jgi:hypothetical protein
MEEVNVNPNGGYLHVVSFDVPYPANYGGVMDVYFKMKSLSECGLKIWLHCFDYGRGQHDELLQICDKVTYYNRKRWVFPFFSKIPYIVASRENPKLLQNLLSDNHPILFEGLHTTFYLNHPSLKNRLKLVRNHNIEHEYYNNLRDVERNFFKKQFFSYESRLLLRYEKQLSSADMVLGISKSDTDYLLQKGIKAQWVSAFHPQDYVDIHSGKGSYILYHGNLGVAENNHAALYLARNVFNLMGLPVVIAGNNPSRRLKNLVRDMEHVTLLDKLSHEEILAYIRNAQINILVTFQATGIKLKLLNALFLGRFVVVNSSMVKDTGLESLCHVADNPLELAKYLFDLWDIDFTPEMVKERKRILEHNFSNAASADKILTILQAGQSCTKPSAINAIDR